MFEEAKAILICKYESETQYQKLGYNFLKHTLEFKAESHPKSSYIRLLISYINHEKLDLVWMSLYRLQRLDSCKPNIQIQFAGTSQLIVIEEQLGDKELRNREASGLDIAYIMNFHSQYFEFTDLVAEASDLHEKFWKELSENEPVVYKL